VSLAVLAAAAAIHSFSGLALSSDGGIIADIERGTGDHSLIVLRAADGHVTGQVDPCATCRYGDLAWSGDGRLAFVASDYKSGQASVYVFDGSQAKVAASVTGLAARPRWSKDGASLAFLTVVNPHKQVGATQAGAKQVGEIGAAETTDEQRIAVVPAPKGDNAGDMKLVSPGDTWVYEYDWMPDGSGFVATAAKGDGDNNWWVAKLEAFGKDGSERVIAAPKMQMNYPRVSADGKAVWFIGGLMSDFGSVGGDVYTVPLVGGAPVDATPGAKMTFTSLAVTGGGVYAGVVQGGETGVARVDGGVNLVWHGPVSTSASDGRVALSGDGKAAAAVVEGFDFAPRIEAGAPGHMVAVTHDNDAVKADFTVRSVTWTAKDGFSVQGWLMAPADVQPGKTYPMVTIVHGGPAGAVTPRFTTGGSAYELLKAGYYVFQPNPRGSFGQGEAFVQANVKDFGGADLGDIEAGIDAVEKVAPVDDARLGIMGHSYGGFMTMWTVTHSNRFKAAVAGAGIANWSSYYGENGIDQWMIPYFGASFYDDPAVYDRLSPIRAIKAAKTPTFIYVGERDVECPAAQSLEFWHGLKAAGVPASLVIYEGEGHGIRAPEHTKDISDRTLAWFGTYLRGE